MESIPNLRPFLSFPRVETVKVFGFPGSGGMKLPYFTLNSVSSGAEEKDFWLNKEIVFPCP